MLVSLRMRSFALSNIISLLIVSQTPGQNMAPGEKIVVSYPSKSITNFPILETARQKGFFQREGLDVSLVYIRSIAI